MNTPLTTIITTILKEQVASSTSGPAKEVTPQQWEQMKKEAERTGRIPYTEITSQELASKMQQGKNYSVCIDKFGESILFRELHVSLKLK